MRDLTAALAAWLETGGHEIGEVRIFTTTDGFTLCHRDDVAREDLETFTAPEAARQLANADDAGKFRPLKTAPNLRHGWKLHAATVTELRRALDYFYPAMLGVWLSHSRSELSPVPLRATLGRQTGMYRVTQKITDAQAAAMIANFCSGCLKYRLWTVAGVCDPGGARVICVPGSQTPATALPLLCHEACNLLVAEARKVVKKSDSPL